ncbi:MAG: NADH-quinone oxidoreductase subunit NuoE [Candidatus Aminicenantes bacterium]|nr:NADH-quinone oxidoreductase subunit NuoE [Candidatus Aminicenantes bacterium]
MDNTEYKKVISQFGNKQKELIHILHKVQNEFGYIPPKAINAVARHLQISEGEIYGVLTFYKAFSLKPRGEHLITICMGTACHVRGAPRILDEFSRRLGVNAGETTADNKFTLETVNCVGACALGPIAITDGEYHGQMKTSDVEKLIEEIKTGERD